MTTASISPCLHVDPENTSSPGFFVAGIDSPVSADWSTKDHGQAILCEKTYNLCLSSRIFIQELAGTARIITELHNMLFSLFQISMSLYQFPHPNLSDLIQELSCTHKQKCSILKSSHSLQRVVWNLVDFQRISIKKASISRDDVTQFYTDDISRHQDHSILFRPFPITENLTAKSRISFTAMVWEKTARL
jgi:hypothetical protein